jgi:hypothetical protein
MMDGKIRARNTEEQEEEMIRILADWIKQPETGHRKAQAVRQYFRLDILVSCLSMHSL